MRATDALADLLRFGKDLVTTEDASLRLRMTRSAATRTLSRLADAGLVLRIRHGLWSLRRDIDPLELPEALTAPFPSYVSLQTALSRHGVLSQIPQVIYVVTLGRTQRVTTALGTYSIHRLPPALFGGYERRGRVNLASAEKALVDALYLTNARSGLFARLPELEIEPSFRAAEARRWAARIPSLAKRTMVETRLDAILIRRERRAR